MVERKKETSRGLVIKGVGYVSPSMSTEKFTNKATNFTSQQAKRPCRGPFVMPSAPVKNVQTSSNNCIAMIPSGQRTAFTSSANRFGSMSNLPVQKDEQCHCQHPADIEFLQDVYLENMRVRMELLELQNKYLKGEAFEGEVPSSSSQATRASNTNKKRVEFADRRLFKKADSTLPEQQLSSPSALKSNVQSPSDQELFDKLEEAYQKEFRLQEKLKALSAENRKLTAAKEEAEMQLNRLNNGEKSLNRERHSLMEDNVELQRRLDDLTPLLAAKDAEIERLEIEKANMVTKIRRLSTGTTPKQERELSDVSASGSLAKRQDLMAKNEEIERLELRLRQFRQKEKDFTDEIAVLKRKLKEEQTLIKREQSLRENYAQENDRLIKENSELASKLSRTVSLVERQEYERHLDAENSLNKSQLAELRENKERMQNEITTLEKRLKNEMESRQTLEDQLHQQEHDESLMQESRHKMQEELRALQALSDSLSAENQGLRQDKLAITQRMELENKEKEFKQLVNLLEDLQQRLLQSVDRLRAESHFQTESCSKLDSILSYVHDISSNLYQKDSTTSTGGSIWDVVAEPAKSLQKQSSVNSPDKNQRIIEEYGKVGNRQSPQLEEESSEKNVRPVLSPIISPIRSKGVDSMTRLNRSLRNVDDHQEKVISRMLSEDQQCTNSSSLSHKYRSKKF